jgi:hypothetical protein
LVFLSAGAWSARGPGAIERPIFPDRHHYLKIQRQRRRRLKNQTPTWKRPTETQIIGLAM